MKFKTILNTGIKHATRNGGRQYEEIFINDKGEKFRIEILSEDYYFQSYGKLSKWSDIEGWKFIHSKNPYKDYNINIAYENNYSQTVFSPIIRDLKKLAENF